MERKSSLILTFFIVMLTAGAFAGCGEAVVPPVPVETFAPLSEEGHERLLRAFDEQVNFWGTALIMQEGETIIHGAFGMACNEQSIANTLDTPFFIASITKQFTGAAILMLEAEGKLNTTNTLDNFFPGHDSLVNVTIADLLTMRGSFGPNIGLNDLYETYGFERIEALSLADIETLILTAWSGEILESPNYSSWNYWLLGRIIEQVSGMAYEEFVKTRIFAPVGMQNSGFAGSHHSAMPHNTVYNHWDDILIRPFPLLYSSAGIVSTVNDLNLWLEAYFGGKLFPEYRLSQIYNGSYNYGWEFDGSGTWMHSGILPGFRGYIIYDKDSDTRIILLSNSISLGADHRQLGAIWYLMRLASRELLGRTFHF